MTTTRAPIPDHPTTESSPTRTTSDKTTVKHSTDYNLISDRTTNDQMDYYTTRSDSRGNRLLDESEADEAAQERTLGTSSKQWGESCNVPKRHTATKLSSSIPNCTSAHFNTSNSVSISISLLKPNSLHNPL